MKPIRASVHQEARINMKHCANQVNGDSDSDVTKMNGFSSSRSWPKRWCLFQDQPSSRPAMGISTMLHIFYISAFYLFFTINTITLAAAAGPANDNQWQDGGRIGVYAALSAADSNVPTTTAFGEYQVINTVKYSVNGNPLM